MARSARLHRNCVLALALLALRVQQTWAASEKSENWPVRRPLVDLRESARQTVGRDGPRYPDEGFLRHTRMCRAPYSTGDKGGSKASAPGGESCDRSYVVLTMANDVAMRQLVPLLLDSLARVPQPPPQRSGAGGEEDGGGKGKGKKKGDKDEGGGGDKEQGDLTQHTAVVGVTTEAERECIQLQSKYGHQCLADGASGLYDGDHKFPSYKALAFGMSKLRYILNALTTGSDVLYVDADVVLLADPFPALFKSGADIAVGTAACGSVPRPLKDQGGGAAAAGAGAGAGRRLAASQPPKFSTGVVFYRSTPGVLRCVYSQLLDMAAAAQQGAERVWEQEHFADTVPMCASALGLQLEAVPEGRWATACAAGWRPGGGKGGALEAVHAALEGSLKERAPLLKGLLEP